MSPNIEIDDDVYDFLKSNAEPFVDTPNSVLRRMLGIDGDSSRSAAVSNPAVPVKPAASITAVPMTSTHGRLAAVKRTRRKGTRPIAPTHTRAASGTLLPEEKYERPLLKVLAEAGGQAPYRDVVDAIGRELRDDFMPADYESLKSGGIRWQSRLQFVRIRLIERGYLDKDAPRGVWAITDAGRAALKDAEE